MLTLGVPVSGTIGVPRQVDEWNFFGAAEVKLLSWRRP